MRGLYGPPGTSLLDLFFFRAKREEFNPFPERTFFFQDLRIGRVPGILPVRVAGFKGHCPAGIAISSHQVFGIKGNVNPVCNQVSRWFKP